MEKELNIAEILKDKPQGTKLYDLLYNVDVELDTISTTDTDTVVWCTNETDNNTTCHRGYSEFGTVRGCPDGLQILLPSKKMRDWRKFAWKKGDILEATLPLGEKHMCIFDHWSNDDYSSFIARYDCQAGKTEINDIWRTDKYCLTKDYSLVIDTLQMTGKHKVETFIDNLEWKFKGKLNLNTLELIKHPILENGNILILHTINRFTYVFISNGIAPNSSCHAYLSLDNPRLVGYNTTIKEDAQIDYVTYATEEEKQRLFDALTKEGKRWNAEKKIIEYIKKEHQFEPFEKVLARDSKDSLWHIDLYEGMLGDDSEYNYSCMASDWVYCIPYEGNEHLLCTTKDVEG